MPSPRVTSGPMELRDYLGVLRRRKLLIALVALVPLLISIVLSVVATPVYEARAQVLVLNNNVDALLNGQAINSNPTADQVAKEAQLMANNSSTFAVAKKVGYLPRVKVTPPADASKSATIVVAARASTAGEAVKTANDFVHAYVDVRKASVDTDLTTAAKDTKEEIDRLFAEAAITQKALDELKVQVAAEKDPAKKAALQAQIAKLEVQADPARVQSRQAELLALLDRISQARLSNESRGVFNVSDAFPPKNPISPQPIRNGLIALAIGLMLGVSLAFLRDYFDDTFRTKEDLDAVSGGVPVLGIVPAIADWRDRKTALLESVTHPSSAAAEAYRSLRTSLEFLGIDRKIHIVHVTSSASGEGKSTTSANLAVSLARAGKHVVLVDCDLRRPRMHEFFGMDNSVGLTSLILGTASIEEALVPAPGIPGLMILASGPTPPNPSELLSTKTAQSKLEALARSADYVVVDSPPLLPVSDSVILARYAHATLLVVTARSTTRRALDRSLELLRQVDAPLEGIVFNGVAASATYGYGYGYGYAYGYGSNYGSRGGSPAASPAPASTDGASSTPEAPHRALNGAAPGVEREPAEPKTR